jgi:hypothetical protein
LGSAKASARWRSTDRNLGAFNFPALTASQNYGQES